MSKASVEKYLQDRGFDPSAQYQDIRAPQQVNLAPKAGSGDFLSNLGNSVSSIAGGVGNFIGGGLKEMLSENSFAKIPQILSSIGKTGFELGPIKFSGSTEKRGRDVMDRLRKLDQDFQSKKITLKEFKEGIDQVKKDQAAISGTIDESGAALKDASQYKRQFVNNVSLISTAMSGVNAVAGKTVLNEAGKEAVKNAYSSGASGFLKGVSAEAGLPGMVQRQAIQGANALTTGLKMGAHTVGNIMDAQAAASLTDKDGLNPANIALTASSVLPGGPIGALSALSKAVTNESKKLFVNSYGVFDKIAVKGGSVNSQLAKVMSKDPEKGKQLEDVLRVAQDNILKQYKGDKSAAASAINDYLGVRTKKLSLDQLAGELNALATGNTKAQSLAKLAEKGKKVFMTADGKQLLPGELKTLGAVKSTQTEVAKLSKALSSTTTPEEARAAISAFYKENTRFASNAQNRGLLESLSNGGMFGKNAADMVKTNLKGTNQIFERLANGKLKPVTFDNGYYLGTRSNLAAGFAKVADTAALDTGNQARFGKVGDTLKRFGISATEQESGRATRVFKQVHTNVADLITERGINTHGNNAHDVIDKLTKFSETKAGITDLRQINWKEVGATLGTSDKDSKAIVAALKDSFLKLPLSERGLANKIMDMNLAKNPLAAPYSRAQSVARYEKNPFFRLQENLETKIGTAAFTGATASPTKDYTQTINLLKEAKIFQPGYAGQGAMEGFGQISARLSRSQERNIAAGFESLASKAGVPVAQFIGDPKNQKVVDILKGVVQYPDKGMVSSDLMKFMNLATFPARYNVKVAQLAVKALGQQNGIRQVAVVRGLTDFKSFLDSTEGQKWQSKNSEVIGLFRYFTPIGSVESVYKLLKGDIQNPRDIGLVGGLPFGVISQVLQGQGLINLDSPYIDPKTGKVKPDKIPQDIKARAAQLLSDIVGTMYTYPGRMIGAPSKSEITSKVVDTFTAGGLSNAKYKNVERKGLNYEQERTVRALQAGNVKPSVVLPKSIAPIKLTSSKPVTFNPVYKSSKAKKGKTFARPVR